MTLQEAMNILNNEDTKSTNPELLKQAFAVVSKEAFRNPNSPQVIRTIKKPWWKFWG